MKRGYHFVESNKKKNPKRQHQQQQNCDMRVHCTCKMMLLVMVMMTGITLCERSGAQLNMSWITKSLK